MKTRQLSVILVEYDDLEDLIKETFGHEFSIPEDLESGNDTYHLFKDIIGNPGITFFNDGSSFKSRLEIDELNIFKATGKHSFLTSTILEELCKQEKIEKGHYLINISW